eukprot:m.135375 g.135375  ORF g.135375 m.135375 type:complete len:437 (+) comp15846_c0_seq1:183-1493(+)
MATSSMRLPTVNVCSEYTQRGGELQSMSFEGELCGHRLQAVSCNDRALVLFESTQTAGKLLAPQAWPRRKPTSSIEAVFMVLGADNKPVEAIFNGKRATELTITLVPHHFKRRLAKQLDPNNKVQENNVNAKLRQLRDGQIILPEYEYQHIMTLAQQRDAGKVEDTRLLTVAPSTHPRASQQRRQQRRRQNSYLARGEKTAAVVAAIKEEAVEEEEVEEEDEEEYASIQASRMDDTQMFLRLLQDSARIFHRLCASQDLEGPQMSQVQDVIELLSTTLSSSPQATNAPQLSPFDEARLLAHPSSPVSARNVDSQSSLDSQTTFEQELMAFPPIEDWAAFPSVGRFAQQYLAPDKVLPVNVGSALDTAAQSGAPPLEATAKVDGVHALPNLNELIAELQSQLNPISPIVWTSDFDVVDAPCYDDVLLEPALMDLFDE